ncbi:hypothetical protein CD351_14765 [Erythrobacter sp. KY5]|uniref:hypothetical protein n=1 Tax=Erythrobacter sp. KY5 TaxID=2011159 RepID=UPI000DBF37CF|nr:hypothetical protein [Erythrobacter sp. KY5]AWW75695.1 hypothetical protein CD351_14765 [Erythrobacter sp. KY5]
MTSASDVRSQLRARLAEYDGQSVTLLGETEAACCRDLDYFDALIELAGSRDGHVPAGATWLIKSALEAGHEASSSQAEALIACLPAITGWAAKLHLCQSIGFLDITPRHTAALANWLEPLLQHERPFVRAWSLDALGHLARADESFADRFEAALAAAAKDDRASVRARARNLAAGR